MKRKKNSPANLFAKKKKTSNSNNRCVERIAQFVGHILSPWLSIQSLEQNEN